MLGLVAGGPIEHWTVDLQGGSCTSFTVAFDRGVRWSPTINMTPAWRCSILLCIQRGDIPPAARGQ